MRITRIYDTGVGGESSFDELEIPRDNEAENANGMKYLASDAISTASDGVLFLDLPQGYESGWHNGAKQLIGVVLSGRLEAETSTGEKRQWGPLEAFMVDDRTGKGHNGRVLEGPARLLYVFLPEDFDTECWKA